MRRICSLVAIIAVIFTVAIGTENTSYAENHKLKILFLQSYDSQNVWTREISSGFFETIEPYRAQVDVTEEFMDTKRKHSSFDYENFSTYLGNKFANEEFSLVVAADNNALNFVKTSELDFLQNVPVVFVGINPDTTNLALPERFSGVYEKVDATKTLNLISQLHPDDSKILVITGESVTSKAVFGQIKEEIVAFEGEQTIELVQSSDLEYIESKLGELDRYDAVLMVLLTADSQGNNYSYNEGLKKIYDRSPAPIYGMWKFYLGSGIIGGYLEDGYDHGRIAADIAIAKLKGERVEIASTQYVKSDLYFDYKELKHAGLESISIPNEAIIINKPTDSLREYALMIIVTAISAAIVTLIMALVYLNRKEHLLNETLEAEKVRLETTMKGEVFSQEPDADFQSQLKYKIETLNRAVEQLTEENHDLRLQSTKKKRMQSASVLEVEAAYEALVQLDLLKKINRLLIKGCLKESLFVKELLTELEISETRTLQLYEKYESGNLKRTDFEQYIENRKIISSRFEGYLLQLLTNSQRIMGLEVLDFDVQHQRRDPVLIIEKSAELAFSENSNDNIRIHLELGENLPYIDHSGYLGYIILQLVSNALIHGFKESSDGVLNIRALRENDHLCIRVIDDGIGMNPEMVETAPEFFVTSDAEEKFSGIGLSNVKYVAEEILGGHFMLTSERGVGTEVSVDIPIGGALNV